MNCDNCGKDEVRFHFTSNINGNVTEKHLCAECAVRLGYTQKAMLHPEMPFEAILTEMFRMRPSRRMFGGYGMVVPTLFIPTIGVIVPGDDSAESRPETAVVPPEIKPEIDEEMKRRREINMLREQMRAAAEEENFEKAAALRDSIRRLENNENL